MSNSAVGQSSLLLPKMSVAPVEKLEAVDRWRVECLSVAVTEAGDRKTLIHRRESKWWVVLSR